MGQSLASLGEHLRSVDILIPTLAKLDKKKPYSERMLLPNSPNVSYTHMTTMGNGNRSLHNMVDCFMIETI